MRQLTRDVATSPLRRPPLRDTGTCTDSPLGHVAHMGHVAHGEHVGHGGHVSGGRERHEMGASRASQDSSHASDGESPVDILSPLASSESPESRAGNEDFIDDEIGDQPAFGAYGSESLSPGAFLDEMLGVGLSEPTSPPLPPLQITEAMRDEYVRPFRLTPRPLTAITTLETPLRRWAAEPGTITSDRRRQVAEVGTTASERRQQMEERAELLARRLGVGEGTPLGTTYQRLGLPDPATPETNSVSVTHTTTGPATSTPAPAPTPAPASAPAPTPAPAPAPAPAPTPAPSMAGTSHPSPLPGTTQKTPTPTVPPRPTTSAATAAATAALVKTTAPVTADRDTADHATSSVHDTVMTKAKAVPPVTSAKATAGMTSAEGASSESTQISTSQPPAASEVSTSSTAASSASLSTSAPTSAPTSVPASTPAPGQAVATHSTYSSTTSPAAPSASSLPSPATETQAIAEEVTAASVTSPSTTEASMAASGTAAETASVASSAAAAEAAAVPVSVAPSIPERGPVEAVRRPRLLSEELCVREEESLSDLEARDEGGWRGGGEREVGTGERDQGERIRRK